MRTKHQFEPEGVCASRIEFELEDGRVKSLRFIDGCPGNLEAISKLVEGMSAAEVIEKFQGIVCQNGTSCASQLAEALREALKTY